jgi:hypothetical protein
VDSGNHVCHLVLKVIKHGKYFAETVSVSSRKKQEYFSKSPLANQTSLLVTSTVLFVV